MKFSKIVFSSTSILCLILLVAVIHDNNFKLVLPLLLLLISQLGMLFFNKTNQ